MVNTRALSFLAVALLVAAVLTAGCTSNTSSSSSSSGGAGQTTSGDRGANLISFVQSQGYKVTGNVTKEEKQYGGQWDMYVTQAKDSSGKQVSVVAKAFNSTSQTADMYHSNVNSYTSKAYGYTIVNGDNTKTTLKGPKGDTVIIYQDPTDNMVVTILQLGASGTAQAGT